MLVRQGSGFRAQGSEFRLQGGLRVEGSGFRGSFKVDIFPDGLHPQCVLHDSRRGDRARGHGWNDGHVRWHGLRPQCTAPPNCSARSVYCNAMGSSIVHGAMAGMTGMSVGMVCGRYVHPRLSLSLSLSL